MKRYKEGFIEAISYSNFRQILRSYIKPINEGAEPFIVTTKEVEDTVVVQSKRDYNSRQESLRILSNNYLTDKIRKGDEEFLMGKWSRRMSDEHRLIYKVENEFLYLYSVKDHY